jgi:DNA-binding GntR family transcriptional regulator
MSTKLATAKRTPRAYAIAERIEADIVAGKLKPSERLLELELAARFGVSRAPIREALKILERDGFVFKGSHGVRVAAIEPRDVAEIFEILAYLEELYTTWATPSIDEPGLGRMRTALQDMERAVTAKDVHSYFTSNLQFHQVIRDACPNRRIIELLNALGKQLLRYRHLAMSLPGRLPVSLEEHQLMVDAIASKDAVSAGQYARLSTERAYDALRQFLELNPQLI